MENMIGKTINVPDDIRNALKQIQKEKDILRQSAKSLFREAEVLKEDLMHIAEENMEELRHYHYMLNLDDMNVVILSKKRTDTK